MLQSKFITVHIYTVPTYCIYAFIKVILRGTSIIQQSCLCICFFGLFLKKSFFVHCPLGGIKLQSNFYYIYPLLVTVVFLAALFSTFPASRALYFSCFCFVFPIFCLMHCISWVQHCCSRFRLPQTAGGARTHTVTSLESVPYTAVYLLHHG